MTYREWIKATMSKFNISVEEVELILTNQSTLIQDPDEQVVVPTAKRAIYNEFASIIPMANTTEGGYSISWNMEAIKIYHRSIAAELGLPDVTAPKVKNASTIW